MRLLRFSTTDFAAAAAVCCAYLFDFAFLHPTRQKEQQQPTTRRQKKTTEAGKRNKQCSAMLNAFTSPCVFGKMQCSKF